MPMRAAPMPGISWGGSVTRSCDVPRYCMLYTYWYGDGSTSWIEIAVMKSRTSVSLGLLVVKIFLI